MHISFSPQRSDEHLALEKSGDTLTLNGQSIDLSAIGEGDELAIAGAPVPLSDFLVTPITRIGGVLTFTLRLPCSADAASTRRFPASVTASDGAITLPGDT